ncbi:MAG: hypothetical protein KUG82_14915 [Pseudomonadales bacterium]|nr:hypothetical protein [Pseudomonadales bacterium]
MRLQHKLRPSPAHSSLQTGLIILSLLFSTGAGACKNASTICSVNNFSTHYMSGGTTTDLALSPQPSSKRRGESPRNDKSWYSIGAGATTGKHSGLWLLFSSTAMTGAKSLGTTRFIWSQDLSKASTSGESFTYLELGQLFGMRHKLHEDNILWGIGPALVFGNDKVDTNLDFRTIGLAWEVEAHLSHFLILGGSVKLAGNLNRPHSQLGISFHLNIGNSR